MLGYLALVTGGLLLFSLATIIFHFFARTIAGVTLMWLFLGRADLAASLGLPSVFSPGGDKDTLVILLTLVLFLWCIPGLIFDIAQFETRLRHVLERIE